MGGDVDPLRGAEAVAPDRERPLGGDLRVELAEGTGSGVARVRERRLPGRGAPLVELGEGGTRHVDLAANLDQLRAVVDPRRDVIDRPQVGRHVLSDHPVAAGRAAHERASAIGQRDREAVDLRLRDEAQLLRLDVQRAQAVVEAGLPGAELLGAAGVRKREHRLRVADLLESVERAPGDALGRGVGRDELGMRRLELAQLAYQRVVCVVADLGVVQLVVAVVVVCDLAPQLLDPVSRRGGALDCAHGSVRAGRASTAAGKASPSACSSSASRRRSSPLRSVRSKWTGVIDTRPSATAVRSVPGSSW